MQRASNSTRPVEAPLEGTVPSVSAKPGAAPSRRRRLITPIVVIGALLLDQTTKWLVLGLAAGHVDASVFHIRLVANRGGLLGVPVPPLILTAAAVLTAMLAIRAGRKASITRAAALGLIAGGALGNGLDRVIDRVGFPPGAVVDWLAIWTLPTFNLADVALVAGFVLIAVRPTRVRNVPPRPWRSGL